MKIISKGLAGDLTDNPAKAGSKPNVDYVKNTVKILEGRIIQIEGKANPESVKVQGARIKALRAKLGKLAK